MQFASSKFLSPNSPKKTIFNRLLNYVSELGYNFETFLKICRTEHRKDSDCSLIWLQLINLAEKLMLLQNKRPAASVLWFIDTAFPIASMLMSEKYRFKLQQATPYIRSEIIRLTGNKARLEEETKRSQLYGDLLAEENKLYSELS